MRPRSFSAQKYKIPLKTKYNSLKQHKFDKINLKNFETQGSADLWNLVNGRRFQRWFLRPTKRFLAGKFCAPNRFWRWNRQPWRAADSNARIGLGRRIPYNKALEKYTIFFRIFTLKKNLKTRKREKSQVTGKLSSSCFFFQNFIMRRIHKIKHLVWAK